MKRNEFKLLMEDWKRNFVTEDEVVSNTLNEGYTELDRMILEEGLMDNPVIKKVVKLGVPLGLAATLFSSGLLNNNYSTDSNTVNTKKGGIHQTVNDEGYPAGVGSFLGIPSTSDNIEYQELFNSDDVQNILDNLDDLSEKSVTEAISNYVDSKLEKDPNFKFPERGKEDLGDKQEMLSIFKSELPNQVSKYLSRYSK